MYMAILMKQNDVTINIRVTKPDVLTPPYHYDI